MLVKIYWTLWAAVGVVAAILLLTGNFTMLTTVVFGFIGFGLTFMGMISVLPSSVVQHAPAKIAKPAKVKAERVFASNRLAAR